MVISLGQGALQHFRRLLSKTNHRSILLGVQGGGCNGLRYLVEPTSGAADKMDEELSVDGVHFIVCGKSLLHLIGTTIHWEDDALGSSLRFDNPNARSTCGCGETFS